MDKPWFRPKRFGYGATPVSWQGWLIIALFVAGLVADVTLVPTLFAVRETRRVVSIAGAAVLVAALLWVTLAKGAGPWRWRWGEDD